MSTPTLPTRRIGKDNVTAIGFGAMVCSMCKALSPSLINIPQGIGGLDYGSNVGGYETRFKVWIDL